MGVLNRDNFMNAVNNLLGDRTDEEALNLVGDITDTFNDMEKNAGEDMIPRSELDRANKEWADKYKRRFFDPPSVEDKENEIQEQGKEKENKKLTYDNLFSYN